MAMTLSNYSGAADTFTFPNNPQVFDDEITANYTNTLIDYQRHHMIVSGGGVSPKQIILTGFLFGTTKNTNYNTLSGHFMGNTRLKKLYFDTDRFYLGVGKAIKKTHSSGRTNFLDYVGTFETIIGILFDNTQKTHTDGGAEQTNEGNVTTFIEEIRGQYDGSGDVVIADLLGNEITIPSSSFSGTEKVILLFLHMVDSGDGIYVSEYNYAGLEVDSGTTTSTTSNKLVQTGQNFTSTVSVGDLVYNTTDSTYANVTAVDSDTILSLDSDIMTSGESFVIYTPIKTVKTTDGFGILKLGSGRDTSDISVSNLSAGYTLKFRDGHSS